MSNMPLFNYRKINSNVETPQRSIHCILTNTCVDPNVVSQLLSFPIQFGNLFFGINDLYLRATVLDNDSWQSRTSLIVLIL